MNSRDAFQPPFHSQYSAAISVENVWQSLRALTPVYI